MHLAREKHRGSYFKPLVPPWEKRERQEINFVGEF